MIIIEPSKTYSRGGNEVLFIPEKVEAYESGFGGVKACVC